MAGLHYKFAKDEVEHFFNISIPDVQNAQNFIETVKKLAHLLGLENQIKISERFDAADANIFGDEIGIIGHLHTHPKMEAALGVNSSHVIVDKEDQIKARKEHVTLENMKERIPQFHYDNYIILNKTFEKLVGNLDMYSRDLQVEMSPGKQGDSMAVIVTSPLLSPILDEDKGAAARQILKEITNKK